MVARRFTISGRVQGVGYRMSLVDVALAAGVRGWVRNRRDGTVEALVQGEVEAVDRVLSWCRRGPAGARVTAVAILEVAGDPSLDRFETIATV